MNTPPDGSGNIVSVAINSDGVWKPTPLAVDASTSEAEYNLILVTLSSPGGPATEDIHVTMVSSQDSLANYNKAKETDYVMPGGAGTPAFTLVDGGVVTIPKGSNYGYLKIKTVTANYFGSATYAFSYRISGVQESGYIVSANNGYSITPFIPKNKYDGTYLYGPGLVERFTGCCTQNPSSDALQGPFTSLDDADLETTGLNTLAFSPLWSSGGGVAGIDGTYITVGTTPLSDGTLPVVMACSSNATLKNIAGETNNYDPATKTFKLAFEWGAVNKRTVRTTLVYKGPRK